MRRRYQCHKGICSSDCIHIRAAHVFALQQMLARKDDSLAKYQEMLKEARGVSGEVDPASDNEYEDSGEDIYFDGYDDDDHDNRDHDDDDDDGDDDDWWWWWWWWWWFWDHFYETFIRLPRRQKLRLNNTRRKSSCCKTDCTWSPTNPSDDSEPLKWLGHDHKQPRVSFPRNREMIAIVQSRLGTTWAFLNFLPQP